MPGQDSPKVFLSIDTGTHSATIRQLLVTPDGRSLITASADRTICVWDIASRKLVRRILGQIGTGINGDISSVALDAQGRYLYAAVTWLDEDELQNRDPHTLLRVYELSSGKLITVCRYGGNIVDMRFSADGKYLVIADAHNRMLGVFDPQSLAGATPFSSPAPVAGLQVEKGGVPKRVCIYPRWGQYHIVCSNSSGRDQNGNTSTLTWYTFDGRGLRQLKTHPVIDNIDVDSVVASQRYVAVSGRSDKGPDQGLLVYDLNGNWERRILPEPADHTDAGGICFSADGKWLMAGALDIGPVLIRVYDVAADFALHSVYNGHDASVRAVAFLADGTAVSAGGAQYAIHFWNPFASPPQGQLLGTITGSGQIVEAVGLRQTPDRIGSIAIGNHALPQPASDNPLNLAPLQHVFNLHDCTLQPLAAGEVALFARAVHQWEGLRLDWRQDDVWLIGPQGETNLTMVPHRGQHADSDGYDAWTLGFTPRGTIITGDVEGNVRVAPRGADGRYRRLPWRFLRAHTAPVLDHAIQGDWLVTAGMDQVLRLWYLPDVEQYTLEPLDPALNLFIADNGEWVIWSQGGYHNASAHGDRYIGYHANQGEGHAALFYASDRFTKVLYRPDIIRAILATGSEQRALQQLELAKPDVGTLLPPLVELGTPGVIITSQFEASVRFVVTPDTNPVVRIWILRNGQVVWETRSDAIAAGGSYEHTIALLPGDNRVAVFAESLYAKSNPAMALVRSGALDANGPTAEGGWKATDQPAVVAQSLSLELDTTLGGGVVVQVQRNDETVWSGAATPDAATGRLLVKVPLQTGDNKIDVLSGTAEVMQHTLSIRVIPNRPAAGAAGTQPAGVVPTARGDGTPDQSTTQGWQPVAPNLYLLALGVSTLANPAPEYDINNLRFAHADALSIADAFQSQSGPGRLFASLVPISLVNEQATRSAIVDALTQFSAAINVRVEALRENHQVANDVALIFLAGHGVNVDRPGSEGFYFWNYDFDVKDPLGTGIRLMDLGQQITSIPIDLVFMIDTCHAGESGSALISSIDPQELVKRLIDINERALVILNATRSTGSSYEDPMWQHGYFTQGVLNALATATEKVTVQGLADYVEQHVPVLSENRQLPTFRVFGEMVELFIYQP